MCRINTHRGPTLIFWRYLGLQLRILKHSALIAQGPASAWASAHRGKWSQLTRPPGKMDQKLKSENRACLCYILRAIRAGRCRERRYGDHIFIQIYMYFRMHHFVVKFSKFSSPLAARGH